MNAETETLARAATTAPAIALRPAVAADAEAIGRICYEAFTAFHTHHRFTPDFPSVEAAVGLARHLIADPKTFGVVATRDGAIVGSNFLSEGDPVRGVGPISVATGGQNAGIGRLLMEAVVERGRDALGVRLVQDAFNTKTMALYTSVGFDPREPLAVMTGRVRGTVPAGYRVRRMTPDDIRETAALSRKVHGFARTAELSMSLATGEPVVVERAGRITAYMARPTFWLFNHAVAETEVDLKVLIRGAGVAAGETPLAFLMPIRQATLFRWCLEQGMRVEKPMTLMSRGHYSEPNGAWLPSVLF